MGPAMRRWATVRRWGIVAAVLIVATTASTTAGASDFRNAAVVRPDQTWTFGDGAFCETDSFGHHGTFSGTNDEGAPVGGTYVRKAESGPVARPHRHLTMTWTTGPSAGARFEGTLRRLPPSYEGSYTDAGSSVGAELGTSTGPACPTVTVAPTSSSIDLGARTTDTMTLSGAGGVTPTGSVNFAVCPGAAPCDPNSAAAVDLGPGTLSGSGDTATATSSGFTPNRAGTYCFWASYDGSRQYLAIAEMSTTDQCLTVTRFQPQLTTIPSRTSIVLGGSNTDSATFATVIGDPPSGTVSFFACGPLPSATGCTSSAGTAFSPSVPVTTEVGMASAPSQPFTPTATGTYCFLAVYSGDTNYAPSSDGSADECFTVTPKAPPLAILALNKVSPHEILGGGTGRFVVAGDIVLNTDVSHQQWTGSAVDPATQVPWAWDDAIDAKTGSNLYVYGTIHSSNATDNGQSLWPLDTCFQPNIVGEGNPANPIPAYQPGDPAAQLPAVQMTCLEHGGSVNIDYDNIDPTYFQFNDPLSFPGAPPDPFSASTDIACPGSTLATDPPMTVDANGVTQLTPGEYTTPVEITDSANFQDCPGGGTGVYRFDQGLWINPQTAGQAVTGSNVLIATENPYPVAGNVPGSIVNNAFVAGGPGNGAPCLPSSTMTSGPSGNGTPMPETSADVCGGTSPATYGVVGYGDSTFTPDPTESGTGTNFSVIIGGAAGTSVTLTGPTSGPYGNADEGPGVVLYQDPNTQANDGLDAESGDGADITINGVVYNASLSDYGANAPLDYWDGSGGGIPFFAGGTLQAGFGAGWSPGPAQSTGSVTLNGTTIVDDYTTDGATAMTVIGQPYLFPVPSAGALAGHLAHVSHVSTGHSHRSSKKATRRQRRHHR